MSIPPGRPDHTGAQAGLPACVRHPDRPTGLSCTRCGRPACPDCLREASVGYQCVDCVAQGERTVRRATTVAGAELATRSVLVPALIVVNVAVFALTVVLSGSISANGESAFSHALSLFAPSTAEGEYWRLLTSGFLHDGPVHLLLNMVALWFVGRDMELLLGKVRFAVLYLLSLLGGGVAVYTFAALGTDTVGASGAIYGLLGGLVVAVVRLKLDRRTLMTVVGVLAINLAVSVSIPQISLLGHLGGLVVGALATFGMVYAPPARRTQWQVGTAVLILVALVGLFVLRTSQLDEVVYCTDPAAMVCFQRI